MRTAGKILLYLIISIQTIFWVLLMSGNLTLNGLKLSGGIISTAIHEHGKCDNSFITNVDFIFDKNTMEFNPIITGTPIKATNIFAPSGVISGGYFVNNGALYQHSDILFSEGYKKRTRNVYLSEEQKDFFTTDELLLAGFKKNTRGWYKETFDPLAPSFVDCSGNIYIKPLYDKNGIEIVGTFIDRDGVHKVAPEEVERIKKLCVEEIEKSQIIKQENVKKRKRWFL